MKVLHSIEELSTVPGPVCVAIGVFDGVHLGHRELIHRTMREAASIGGSAVVLTFDPHPARILRPDKAPRLLTSTPHKQQLVAKLGCEYLLVVKFDAGFAAQSPENFVEKLVQHAKPLAKICVGHQWAFGKGRSGNVPLLHALGAKWNFETLEIDPVLSDGELVSSTQTRLAIERGDLETARRYLGRDYTILGTVSHGAGLGARIGFPTANLAAHNEQFPPNGVYATRILLGKRQLNGVLNIGVRPTVNQSLERVLEVHIFDFAEDCYGKDVEVRFEKFLRPEQKFDSVDALCAQIARDAAEARAALT